MRVTASSLVAEIIERLEGEPAERGRPRLPVADVVGTLRFFLREGVQWRELPASDGRASGSTLRRRLREWRDTAVLARVHAVLLRMARSDPETAARELDVIVDSCSAKHGGELTGPNPTDRGKRGTKYHIVVSTEGLPWVRWPRSRTSTTPRATMPLSGCEEYAPVEVGLFAPGSAIERVCSCPRRSKHR